MYISDGLIPDDDEEAWSFGVVPMHEAVLASANVQRRCLRDNTRAGHMTQRLREAIKSGSWSEDTEDRGPQAFVRAIQQRGERAMLALMKQRIVEGR